MSEVNDYAKRVIAQAERKRGRPQGWTRRGSVLAGKMQTPWEVSVTASTLEFHKNRWANLFAKPLNKWRPTTGTKPSRVSPKTS